MSFTEIMKYAFASLIRKILVQKFGNERVRKLKENL